MESSRVRELRARLNDHAEERLQPDDLRPRIWIDGALAFRSISEQVASEMTTLAPFGPGSGPYFAPAESRSLTGRVGSRIATSRWRSARTDVSSAWLACRRAGEFR